MDYTKLLPEYITQTPMHLKAYLAFKNMKARCNNPSHAAYKDYGGRGIKIEGVWNLTGPEGFNAFIKDIGLPTNHEVSLDRKDNDGNYSKDNCRWATKTEQVINQRRFSGVSYAIGHKKSLNKYQLSSFVTGTGQKTYIGLFPSRELAEAHVCMLQSSK
jgi:hypothetical protein